MTLFQVVMSSLVLQIHREGDTKWFWWEEHRTNLLYGRQNSALRVHKDQSMLIDHIDQWDGGTEALIYVTSLDFT
jgi:hypothetical protein